MLPVDQILNSRLSESRILDFKRTLDLSNRKEFLKDIASFLNAAGGQIIIGVHEEQGIPIVPIEGFSFANLDQSKLQVESIIRSGITPTFQGVQVIDHEFGDKQLIELRIPRGYDKPYQVTYEHHDKFYLRGSAGKHKMDRNEIKQMFLNTNLIHKQIDDFVDARINFLPSEEYLFQNSSRAAVVMHLVPHSSFFSDKHVDLQAIARNHPSLDLLPGEGYANWNNMGLVYQGNKIGEYTQVFRNGIIEAFSTSEALIDYYEKEDGSITKVIPSTLFENHILGAFPAYLEILKSIPVQLPISININIINAVGLSFAGGPKNPRHKDVTFNKSRLPLRSSVMNTYDDNFMEAFKPIFDSLWNTFGYPLSLNTQHNLKKYQ